MADVQPPASIPDTCTRGHRIAWLEDRVTSPGTQDRLALPVVGICACISAVHQWFGDALYTTHEPITYALIRAVLVDRNRLDTIW